VNYYFEEKHKRAITPSQKIRWQKAATTIRIQILQNN
jgi:hypothetical protein